MLIPPFPPRSGQVDSFSSSGSDGSDRTMTYSDDDLLRLFGEEGADFALRPNKYLRKLGRIAAAGKVKWWLDRQ